jgi:hypothetical protein
MGDGGIGANLRTGLRRALRENPHPLVPLLPFRKERESGEGDARKKPVCETGKRHSFSKSGGFDLAPVWWTELKGEHVFEIHRAVVAQRRV